MMLSIDKNNNYNPCFGSVRRVSGGVRRLLRKEAENVQVVANARQCIDGFSKLLENKGMDAVLTKGKKGRIDINITKQKDNKFGVSNLTYRSHFADLFYLSPKKAVKNLNEFLEESALKRDVEFLKAPTWKVWLQTVFS